MFNEAEFKLFLACHSVENHCDILAAKLFNVDVARDSVLPALACRKQGPYAGTRGKGERMG
eukprot:238399-Hanusia_phi.AAC.2